jgi:thiamine biosynthesis lipoprotein
MFRRFSFSALGVENELTLAADSEQFAGEVFERLVLETKEIEARYSRYRPESLLSEINKNAGVKAVKVDAETAALLDYAALLYRESTGLFDITSGVLRRVWDFKEKRAPSADEVAEISRLIGWDKVSWKNGEIFLPLQGMEIDFGGIGKEYCADRLCAVARKQGIVEGLINLGGDVRVIGSTATWNIGILHPRKKGEVLLSVPLKEGAIATSGDYERFIEIDGKRYCHILNPKTGFPTEDSFQSVSVFSPSCLVSGTATTVAMLYGEQRGARYLDRLKLPYLAVMKDGTLIKKI